MVKNHIQEILINKFGHQPTADQLVLFSKLAEYLIELNNPNAVPDKVFILKGYAGTGKTSVMSAMVKSLPSLKMKAVLLAPTGRAAKVLSTYSHQTASTIHKKIYRQKSHKDGMGEFALDKNLHRNTLFIVDEASMISNESFENSAFGSGKLLDDLFEYVYSGTNCRLILVGDTAQLPPVGLVISPALDANVAEAMGFEFVEVEMRQVVRQKQQSGILYNATLLREQIASGMNGYPKFECHDFTDITRLSGADLIEELENCYKKFGRENTMVICRSNVRANRYNEGIRRTILWHENELATGDYLMVVKNNYFWLKEEDKEKTGFIANGDIVEITRVGKYKEVYGYRFADVSIRFIDYPELEIDTKILLDTLSSESAALSSEQNKQLFYAVMEDYAHLNSKKDKITAVKENLYFNALQVKFSYAVTCHKAQGGQWNAVFIDQGWINDEMLNIEFLRWLYTAFTRPTEKLYLVNFKDEFFA